MIYFCTDFRKADLDKLCENVPANERFRIKNLIKNPEKQLQSAAAWALLSFAANLDGNTETARNADGKPSVVGKNIEFSLSHCGNCVAVAVSDDAIGVDAEAVTKNFPKNAAKRLFSAKTCEEIESSPRPEVEFFLKWTQFESFIKAGGNPSDFEKADPSFFHATDMGDIVLSYFSLKPQTVKRVSVNEILSTKK